MTTTKQLSRNYDTLTGAERAALCIRALARHDDGEFQRLCDSAPRAYWTGPEHSPFVRGIAVLSIFYVSEQLGHALNYWFSVGQTALNVIRDGAGDSEANLDYDFIGNVSAYLYVVNRQAWVRCCDELGIDPDGLADERSHWILDVCDTNMPRIVLSRDELASMFKEKGIADSAPVTADDVLAGWRCAFADLFDADA